MSTMENDSLPPPTSDEAVSRTMQDGFQRVVAQAGVGLVVGGLTGVFLARGAGISGARKVLAGFGAGAGAGSAWTKCSIQIEELLK